MLMTNYRITGAATAILAVLVAGVNGQDECAGLLPDCTVESIYKCGSSEPVCGGDLQQYRDNCPSILLVCTPTGASLVFNEHSSPNNTTDGEPAGDWDWVGFDTFDDACRKIEAELPDCNGPSYKCGSEAVCGELEEWMTCTGNLVVCGAENSVVSSTSTSTTVIVSETTNSTESNSDTTSSSSTTSTTTSTTSNARGTTKSHGIFTWIVVAGASLLGVAQL